MGAAEELYEKWKSQFRKGSLELCVLVLLSNRGRSYGLAIMEQLNSAGVDVTEGDPVSASHAHDKGREHRRAVGDP